MGKDKREGWLKELKAGDTVCVDCGSYGTGNYVLRKIDKITPTGRIVIGGATYNERGCQMGVTGRWNFPNKIVEYTENIKQILKREKVLHKVKNIEWSSLSTEKLLKVIEVLAEEKQGL